MGNSAYKREQAIIFNENRAYEEKRKYEWLKAMEGKPRKVRRNASLRRKYAERSKAVKIKPEFIRDWVELAKVPPSESYHLSIVPKDGNGWVVHTESGESVEYLSTHTFYSKTHGYSTGLLQGYGFNVEIANWDEL